MLNTRPLLCEVGALLAAGTISVGGSGFASATPTPTPPPAPPDTADGQDGSEGAEAPCG
jgi:hypothetical protein